MQAVFDQIAASQSSTLFPHLILGIAEAFLDFAFELIAPPVSGGEIIIGELAHFSLTLPENCFQLPAIRSDLQT